MDGDEHHVLVLIDELYHLLRSVSIRNPYQSGKAPDAVVGMHHIIAGSELVQLFQRQRYFPRTSLVALQVVFMKTVEKLMIGKHTHPQRIIREPFMKGSLNGSKGNMLFARSEEHTSELRHAN